MAWPKLDWTYNNFISGRLILMFRVIRLRQIRLLPPLPLQLLYHLYLLPLLPLLPQLPQLPQLQLQLNADARRATYGWIGARCWTLVMNALDRRYGYYAMSWLQPPPWRPYHRGCAVLLHVSAVVVTQTDFQPNLVHFPSTWSLSLLGSSLSIILWVSFVTSFVDLLRKLLPDLGQVVGDLNFVFPPLYLTAKKELWNC